MDDLENVLCERVNTIEEQMEDLEILLFKTKNTKILKDLIENLEKERCVLEKRIELYILLK